MRYVCAFLLATIFESYITLSSISGRSCMMHVGLLRAINYLPA